VSLKELIEIRQDELDCFDELVYQCAHLRLIWETGLVESYINCRMQIHIQFRTRALGDLFILVCSEDSPSCGLPQTDEQYPPMFIDVHKMIQDPEGMRFDAIAGMVRLQRLDLCNSVFGKPLEFLSLRSIFERSGAFADRKRLKFSWLTLRSDYQFKYEIIQRRPEILKTVPQDEREMGREGILGRIGINFQSAKVLLNIPIELCDKGVKVLLSPEDFVLDRQRRSHDA
jgi:hypothetical protein